MVSAYRKVLFRHLGEGSHRKTTSHFLELLMNGEKMVTFMSSEASSLPGIPVEIMQEAIRMANANPTQAAPLFLF